MIDDSLHASQQIAMATGGPPSLATDAVPPEDQAAPRPSGYRPEIFEKKEDKDKYACLFCCKILREPFQSRECGHRLCEPCVKEIEKLIQSGNNVNCRACHEESHEVTRLDLKDMFPDKGIRREMAGIITKCPNDMCVWTGPYKEYTVHEFECKHQPVKCDLCNEQVSKNKIDNHKKHECSQRIIRCDHCGLQMPFVQKMTHVKDCPKYPEGCPQCGKQNVARDQMKKHKARECEKRTLSCPVEGCLVSESQTKFMAHLQKDQGKHLGWVLTRMAELEETFNALMDPSTGTFTLTGFRQGAGADLNTSIDVLKAKIEQLEVQLARQGRGQLEQASGGAEAGPFGIGASERLNSMEFKVNSLEPILSVLHGEMNRCIGAIEALEGQLMKEVRANKELRQKVEQYESSINTITTSVTQREAKMKELETRLNTVGQNRPDGTLLWKISNFTQIRQDAVAGNVSNIHSRPFFTGPVGYKMCVRLYPNGDGMGKNTHLSLFFTLMRSEHDALLPWPFKQKVYFMLIDQNFKKHIVDAFRSEPTSSSFQRPTSEMNIATGCPLFMQLTKLTQPGFGYIKDDTMFIRVVVETDGLDEHLKQFDPRNVPLASGGS